uniref:No apical meristem-associated C-terminal domain-containing protein n=1 Tax=Brassica oleracea var. oleracea TaxID=109376 RepID=A0A0D3AVI0_BRAOL
MDHFSLNSPGFVNLLTSQSSQTIDVESSEVPRFSSQSSESPKPVERRKWTQKEDIVLISAWLNTNKDPIVCKFVGSYEAALKAQASGENDNDVMKTAHDIFFNDYQVKFTLEHAWRELRFDQKWRSNCACKDGAKDKRKEPAEMVPDLEDVRPPGVKACKAAKRKKYGKEAVYD